MSKSRASSKCRERDRHLEIYTGVLRPQRPHGLPTHGAPHIGAWWQPQRHGDVVADSIEDDDEDSGKSNVDDYDDAGMMIY